MRFPGPRWCWIVPSVPHPARCTGAIAGHTPGHLSLLIEARDGRSVVLAADAISRPHELTEDRFAGAWDPALARASARRLVALAAERRATLIYGHDPAQWPSLPKAPARVL